MSSTVINNLLLHNNHSYHELIETIGYVIASSAAIAIVSRSHVFHNEAYTLLYTNKVLFIRYDSLKIMFMKFRQKLTIITNIVIGWLFDIGEHE